MGRWRKLQGGFSRTPQSWGLIIFTSARSNCGLPSDQQRSIGRCGVTWTVLAVSWNYGTGVKWSWRIMTKTKFNPRVRCLHPKHPHLHCPSFAISVCKTYRAWLDRVWLLPICRERLWIRSGSEEMALLKTDLKIFILWENNSVNILSCASYDTCQTEDFFYRFKLDIVIRILIGDAVIQTMQKSLEFFFIVFWPHLTYQIITPYQILAVYIPFSNRTGERQDGSVLTNIISATGLHLQGIIISSY